MSTKGGGGQKSSKFCQHSLWMPPTVRKEKNSLKLQAKSVAFLDVRFYCYFRLLLTPFVYTFQYDRNCWKVGDVDMYTN